jgi:hypothetical protein
MTTSADICPAPNEELAAAVRGSLIMPGDPGYDQARASFTLEAASAAPRMSWGGRL